MSDEMRTEDRLIDEALRVLEAGTPGGERGERAASVPDEASETLVRLYTEVIGLVGYAAPPVAPPATMRRRLLALVRGDETLEVVSPAPAEALRWTPAPRVEPSVAPAPPPPSVPAPSFRGAGRERRARRWPLALAAVASFALLGLSGWLWLGLQAQSREIDLLNAELRERETELEATKTRLASLEQAGGQVADLEQRLALVTSPAVEVSPLRPAGDPPAEPGARGVLFVASDHRHWFLFVQGLPPAGAGRDYQLWFIADGQPISAGVFEAEERTPVNLSSDEMPAGTQAVAITVEPDGGAQQPTGPMVLEAAEPFRVL